LNGGCFQPNTAAGLIGSSGFNTPIAPSSCTANVERTQELTVGFWQQLYKGDLGQVRVGAQYEFIRLQAFAGTGTPLTKVAGTAGPQPNAGLNPYNNAVFFSLRYYPFN
jgi:hypothetical protein